MQLSLDQLDAAVARLKELPELVVNVEIKNVAGSLFPRRKKTSKFNSIG